MVLRNVGILSCGRMFAVVGAGVGLSVAAFLSIMTVVAMVMHSFGSGLGPREPLLALGATLFLPVIYGVLGFAAGIVGAFAYNLASPRLGGIELDLSPPTH